MAAESTDLDRIRDQARRWLDDDPDPASRDELRAVLDRLPASAPELADRFAGPLDLRHGRAARPAARRAERHEPRGGHPGRGRAGRLARRRGRRRPAGHRVRRPARFPGVRRAHRPGRHRCGPAGTAAAPAATHPRAGVRGAQTGRGGRGDGDGQPQPAAGQRLQGLSGCPARWGARRGCADRAARRRRHRGGHPGGRPAGAGAAGPTRPAARRRPGRRVRGAGRRGDHPGRTAGPAGGVHPVARGGCGGADRDLRRGRVSRPPGWYPTRRSRTRPSPPSASPTRRSPARWTGWCPRPGHRRRPRSPRPGRRPLRGVRTRSRTSPRRAGRVRGPESAGAVGGRRGSADGAGGGCCAGTRWGCCSPTT